MLQLNQLVGRLGDEVLDHVLVGDVVAALDRVVGVELLAVASITADHGGRAALGRYGVAAHGIDLGDKRYTAPCFGRRNSGS